MEGLSIKNKNHFAIILSGGSGTRLWPYSRTLKPKQFLSFDGEKTLFQKTILRVSKFFKEENIYIVTNEKFYFETKGQLSDLSIANINIVREPESRNTLPAITYGVREINNISKNAIIGVFSSDHDIYDDQGFVESCQNAILPAENDKFVVFGIRPTEPNIGYGYINPGDLYSTDQDNIYNVLNFTEKPDESLANEYINFGYLWNSGMFMFNSKVFLDALMRHQKVIYKNIIDTSNDQLALNYSNVPNISIDYGLLEFIENLVVIKVNFYWTDLGTWNAIHNFLNKNNENLLQETGNVISADTSNSLIMSNEHLIAAYGLKDLIIVHDHDATLICHKDKADNLKPFVQLIKSKNEKFINDHPQVNRPWGGYKVLYEGQGFKIKSIVVKSKHSLSLQLHKYRSEHWVVVSGVAEIINDKQRLILKPGESTFIKAGDLHQLFNNTDDVLEIIEVSTGTYLGEDDIVRYSDRYGRI